MKKQNNLLKKPIHFYSEPDESVAARVLAVVDQGLTRGKGDPQPGKMCVEAAVCYAMGQPHSDQPQCVDANVRDFKIVLNDRTGWAGKRARGQGMRALAIAQLGSNKLERGVFDRALGSVAKSMLEVLLAAEYSRPKPDRSVVRHCRRWLASWEFGNGVAAAISLYKLTTIFSNKKIVARAGYTGKSAKNRLLAQIGLTALIQAKAEGTKFLKLLLKKKRK